MDYIGEGGRTVPIPITYSALLKYCWKKWITCWRLRYIITDYQTIYDSNVIVGGKKVSWGHNYTNISPIYQLIVVGINY